jgi:rRNA maturation endonuclease Nob1
MTKQIFPPRHGDLTRQELEASANRAITRYEDHYDVSINFKFTCEACGERCTLAEPNRLYERGECHACGHETEIKLGGFVLSLTTPQPRRTM